VDRGGSQLNHFQSSLGSISTRVVTNTFDTNNNTDTTNTDTASTNTKEKETARVLVLQALANSISRLKDIADFAEVDTSTAHYHLRNLIKKEREEKFTTAWKQEFNVQKFYVQGLTLYTPLST
jgi:hypothetical protein